MYRWYLILTIQAKELANVIKYTLKEVIVMADTVEIVADFVKETEQAVLVSDGDNNVWLPKSQIDYSINELTKTIVLILPEWLAIDKGLV